MIITIARQSGCGGLMIGEQLALHYGIPLFTRERLSQMAQERGQLEALTNFFDETPADALMLAIGGENDSHITEPTRLLVSNLVGQDSCVIVGRCGNFIFRDRPDLVSVFLTGNEQSRISFLANQKGISLAEAQENVRLKDEQRRSYHLYYTGQVWGDAQNYDLCIDSSRLGVQRTAQLIADYADALSILPPSAL